MCIRDSMYSLINSVVQNMVGCMYICMFSMVEFFFATRFSSDWIHETLFFTTPCIRNTILNLYVFTTTSSAAPLAAGLYSSTVGRLLEGFLVPDCRVRYNIKKEYYFSIQYGAQLPPVSTKFT